MTLRVIPDTLPARAMRPDEGLAAGDVLAQRVHGANDILPAPDSGWRALARDTLRDPMPWFLLGTAALFGVAGEAVESAVLLAALVPLLGMDAYLHRRTRASTATLASRLASSAQALREGRWVTLPARDLLPGDLVRVGSGEQVPADGVIVDGDAVQVDESTLTGESLPVRKAPSASALRAGLPLDERHWVSAGTRLLAGRALVRIASTGAQTRYGEIVRAVGEGGGARTPLQAAIGELVKVLLAAALALCAALAAIRLWQGHGWVDALLSAVTLAVAALPEEFPVVYTFFLGLGVYRLARCKALVRRAVAVENIGRLTCICTDKTGTVTAGRLVLSHSEPAPGHDAASLLALAQRASRADSGDPLDELLLARGAAEAGERLAVFPFTEQRRREVALWRGADGGVEAVMKGAPETVIAACGLSSEEAGAWAARVDGYAATGHKVLACAACRLEAAAAADREPQAGYRFAGLLVFEDPLREGVRDAVAECLRAGMRVVMVTGDHPATARAIAAEIGLGGGRPRVLAMDGDREDAVVEAGDDDVDVVARATPMQKLALVRALQARGEIVAVTGDGVNDVPALQQADVGIAMGERGTRSAREVSPVVLMDDNFRTIVQAVGEGRQLFRNLRLSFAYLLLVHLPLVLGAALIPLSGLPLLYLPIHIVWLELVIHPTAMLAFQDLPGSDPLGRVDRNRRPRFFDGIAWARIAGGGLALTAVLVAGYRLALAGGAVEHARAMTLASLSVASACVAAGLTRLRSMAARLVAGATVVSAAVLIQWPPASRLLHLQPLHGADWTYVAGVGVLAWLVARAVARRIRST